MLRPVERGNVRTECIVKYWVFLKEFFVSGKEIFFQFWLDPWIWAARKVPDIIGDLSSIDLRGQVSRFVGFWMLWRSNISWCFRYAGVWSFGAVVLGISVCHFSFDNSGWKIIWMFFALFLLHGWVASWNGGIWIVEQHPRRLPVET